MNTRVLVVAPAFHGYGHSIVSALRHRGHDALLHEYDLNASRTVAIRRKLVRELPDRVTGRDAGARRLAQERTSAALAAVRASRPDVVITVKGDALGADYWSVVDDSGAHQLLWLYDELARMRFDDAVIASRPSIVSYSPHDVRLLRQRGLRVDHVLDAYDHRLVFEPRPSDDVVFVGARYPERERLLTALHRAGVPVTAYGRDWSAHPVDRLRTWRLSTPDLPNGRDVPRAEAYSITAGAVAALNSHSDQDGFTMRTYEIPGTGGLQLIDRADVAEVYEPGTEVLVFTSDEELVELCRRAQVDRPWARAIAARGQERTLAEHTFDHRVPLLEDAWAPA